jgi:hypothetical protein
MFPHAKILYLFQVLPTPNPGWTCSRPQLTGVQQRKCVGRNDDSGDEPKNERERFGHAREPEESSLVPALSGAEACSAMTQNLWRNPRGQAGRPTIARLKHRAFHHASRRIIRHKR